MSSRDILTKDQEDLLKKIYYVDKVIFGRDKLYSYVRSKYPEYKISRRMIMNWLKNQQIHQLYAPTKTTKNIRHTVLKEPHKQIGIDLVDMQNYEYKNYKYILTGIDLFSKKGYAKPLKNKEQQTVTKAMDELIKKEIKYVGSVRSDQGSEFINETFINMLNKNNIKSVLSLPGKPQSNGNIERFNKTLKKALLMGMKINNNNDWVTIMPIIIKNYNNTIHDTTKQIPDDIDEINDEEIYANVESEIYDKVQSKNDHDDKEYDILDRVRRKLEPDEKTDRANWSTDVYTIYKKFKAKDNSISNTYYYIKKGNEKFTKKYYYNDLMKINKIDNPLDINKKYEISKLIKAVIRNGKPAYIVRWKGYKESDDTVEMRDELIKDVPKLVNKFEKDNNVKWMKNYVIQDTS